MSNETQAQEKFKLTSLEKKWILYDVANSAYVLLVATLVPIYFNLLGAAGNLDEVTYLAYWGYANSVATVISAFAGPVLGLAADREGRKKKIFSIIIAIGSAACLLFGFVRQWLIFLVIFVISRVAFNLGCVIYDSMLGDVTSEDRLDDVSSQGYAFGYIGSCIPFIICLAIYVFCSDAMKGISLGLTSEANAMMIGFILTAAWWFFVSMPLLKVYKQKYFITKEEAENEHFFAQLGNSIKDVAKDRKVGLFLLAFFFYIDGVYTIIDMATAYGTSLGLDTVMLLLALLVTQFVAFPSAIIIGKLSKKYNVTTLISVCIIAYFLIACYAYFLEKTYQFWILAVCVGMFQGGVQALSRSYFTKIIPPEKSGEYFGLYDIIGKGATFMGTMLISVVAQATGKQNTGVASISVLFVIGFILFRLSIKEKDNTIEPVEAIEGAEAAVAGAAVAAGDAVAEAADTVADKAEDAVEAVADTAEDVADKAEDAVEAVADTAEDVADKAEDVVADAKAAVTKAADDKPKTEEPFSAYTADVQTGTILKVAAAAAVAGLVALKLLKK